MITAQINSAMPTGDAAGMLCDLPLFCVLLVVFCMAIAIRDAIRSRAHWNRRGVIVGAALFLAAAAVISTLVFYFVLPILAVSQFLNFLS
jgi:hypothetical protein